MAKTYPTWPGVTEEQAEALSGTTHTKTQIPYVAKLSVTYAALIKEAQRLREIAAWAAQGMVIDEGGLNVGVFPCEYEIAGTKYEFNGAPAQAVTGNDTNYVYLDATGLHIVTDGAGWPGTEHLALAIVVAGASSITDLRDVRHWNWGRGSSMAWSTNAATQNVDLGNYNLDNAGILELIDKAADPAAAGELLRNGHELKVYLDGAVRKILTDRLAVTVPQGGTGLATLTAYALMVGNDAGNVALVSPGTAGVPLVSKGAGANPAFEAINLSNADATTAAALLTSRGGTGTTYTASTALCLPFYLSGALTTGVKKHKFWLPSDFVVTAVHGYADTAPTTQAIIVDVRDATASIFSDVQGNMLQIAATNNNGSVTLPVPYEITAGHMIDVQIEQVGSGTTGSDLSVGIVGYCKHRSGS